MQRLSRATLGQLDAALRPAADPTAVGIVHLGLGAFTRAHQAVYTADALAPTGADRAWGVCGVTQRSPAVVEQLRPQDGLYSVLTRSAAGSALQVVPTVQDVLFAQEETDRLLALLAAPATRLVTLTVTEKGYRHDPATGRLRTRDPEVAADLAGRAPVTVVGQLARGLAARRAAGAGPVSLLSCDNLPANGRVLRGLVLEFCGRLPGGDALAAWVEGSVAFPSSMVDRIVPATTPADLTEAAELLGLEDRGVVVTEPFRQWVVEDDFAAGRPAWERAGAVLTADVAPYEAMKLRLLNGSHSTLAYLGALAGCETVAEAVAEPGIGALVPRLMADDVVPTLRVPDGFDVEAYCAQLQDRFANPALHHRTVQIAMDGSQKLPQRLLGTVQDRLAAGAEPRLACLGVAAWMRYVSAGRTDDGRPLPLDDPLADRLRALTEGAGTPEQTVAALFGLPEVFGEQLPHDPVFRALVIDALTALTRDGVVGAVRALALA